MQTTVTVRLHIQTTKMMGIGISNTLGTGFQTSDAVARKNK